MNDNCTHLNAWAGAYGLTLGREVTKSRGPRWWVVRRDEVIVAKHRRLEGIEEYLDALGKRAQRWEVGEYPYWEERFRKWGLTELANDLQEVMDA